MSKRRGGNKLPPFVYITKEMLKSEAFMELTNASRVTYLLLQAQIKSFGQTEIILPYSQIEKYMDRNTFSRSIKQLVKFGFIKKKQKGGLLRRTNIYSFSEEWREQNCG